MSDRKRPTPKDRAVLVFGGLLIILLGRYFSATIELSKINTLVTVLGSMFFVAGLAATEANRVIARIWGRFEWFASWLGVTTWQASSILIGLTLSLSARSATGNDPMVRSPLHTTLWLAGIIMVLIGCWRPREPTDAVRLDRGELAFLGILILVSIATRGISLNSVPFGVTGDEGSAGLAAWDYVLGKRNNILITGWNSFPAFYFWILSFAQRIAGPTIEAIRFISTIGGTLAVLAVYWATRRMFGRTHAMLSAGFLAVFHFHILFSRVAVSNVWDGFFLALMIGSLWTAWQTNSRWAFILSGVAIGVSQYFYTTSHLLPVYAGVWLIFLRLRSREVGRLPGIVCTVLITAAIVLPLGLFYVDQPNELLEPMKRVSILNKSWLDATTQATGKSPFQLYGEQFLATVLGFTEQPIQGLYNPRTPMLLTIPGGLVFAGFVLSLVRVLDPRYFILILGIMGPIAAGTFSVEAPSAQRLLFSVPMVAILFGLPLLEIRNILVQGWPKFKRAFVLVPFIILGLVAYQDLTFYFLEAMPEGRYSDDAAVLVREMGEYLKEKAHGTQVYMVGHARIGFFSLPSLPYLAPNVDGHDIVWPLEGDEPFQLEGSKIILLFQREKLSAVAELRRLYPDSSTVYRWGRQNNVLFAALEIED